MLAYKTTVYRKEILGKNIDMYEDKAVEEQAPRCWQAAFFSLVSNSDFFFPYEGPL